ncbi:hypothetical protein [uncultured Sphingomonas sp.]|uniref:hypothetical protein n=1 Tax=uncultured Sphingomonas sp. TaxID=158754 RepID=UPI0037486FF6
MTGIRCLFERARNILVAQGDGNWIRGIENALAEWDAGNHDQARSIYRSMVAGGRGFAEYNIWIDDYDQRIAANYELDAIREELWRAINGYGIS